MPILPNAIVTILMEDCLMISNKTIKIIIIIWFALGIFHILLLILIGVVFPDKEISDNERLSYLIVAFNKNKRKYDSTIELINKIDYNHSIGIAAALSQKEIPYELYDQTLDKSIRILFPFFETEMFRIWNGEQIPGAFYKNYIVLGIYSNRTGADLLYTKISKEEFIGHFRDSMEYCVYPEIPKSSKHWIVKLEDNWYLYDGYFRFDLE